VISKNGTFFVIRKREKRRHPDERRDPEGRAKRDGFVVFILTMLRIVFGRQNAAPTITPSPE
jgi:hypothetical protein